MRIPNRWVGIIVLVMLLGAAAYPIGQHFYASHHYSAAESSLKARKFRQADEHVAKCKQLWPREPGVFMLAAQSARRQGDLLLAEDYLATYRKLGGPSTARQFEERLIEVQRANLEEVPTLLRFCIDKPKELTVPAILEAVISGILEFIEANVDYGRTSDRDAMAYAAGMKALEMWEEKYTGEADRTQALVWRGRFALLLRDNDKAATHLQEAIARDADHFEARLYLAGAVGQKSPKEAADHLEILHERDPGNRRVRFALARIRRTLGQAEEAKVLLDGLLADDPNLVSALVERGRISISTPGKLQDARRDLIQAEKLAPNDIDVNAALVSYYQLAGLTRDAELYQRKVREITAAQKKAQDEATRKQKAQK